MKCPICGKDVELQKKQVGLDESGNPILNEYAICRDCKKQWNLDKQRAKKKAAKTTSVAAPANKDTEEPAVKPVADAVASVTEAVADVVTPVAATPDPVDEFVAAAKAAAAISSNAPSIESAAEAVPKKTKKIDGAPQKKRVKKRPVEVASDETAVKPVRKKKALSPEEKAARAEKAANGERPKKKKSAVPKTTKQVEIPRKTKADAERPSTKKRRPVEEDEDIYLGNVPPKKVRKKREHAVRQSYEDMLATDPRSTGHRKKEAEKPVLEEDIMDDLPIARFRVMRILLGILSIAGCGFCVYRGFTSGITSISAITGSALGITYTVLASGMLLTGLLLFIMQGTNNIFAFLLPMLVYLGCGTFAFLNRSEDSILLYAAIGCAVLAVLFIILAITSRGDEEDYENFDDDYDDDYYDDED